MAKKNLQLKLEFDKQFKVEIPNSAKEIFENDLKHGELFLNYEIKYGDLTTMESIYPDGFSSGEMKISSETKGFVTVSVKGTLIRDLDVKFEAELISAIKKDSHLSVWTAGLSDSEPNNYYIDGDEDKTLEVGKASLL